jgi:hypothetical protein
MPIKTYIKGLWSKILPSRFNLLYFAPFLRQKMPVFAHVRGGPSSNIIIFGSPMNCLSIQISAIFR